MARLPRVVIPGIPHHVTQRGNGRQQIFLEACDYALYLDLQAHSAEREQCEVWAYCQMPNHAHVVLVPADKFGLSRTFGESHRRYTGLINASRASSPRFAMSRSTRCGCGCWRGLRNGPGQAPAC